MCPQPSAVYEILCDWGETLCATSPNPTVIVTGGASSVVCVWDVVAAKDKVTCMKLKQVRVFSFVFFFPVLLFPQCPAHLDFSLTATVRSHGRCDVPGCVRGPQHDRERLPRPHLHPVGPGGAELHHPANWTRSRRLSSGVQRPHRKRPNPFAATFFANPVRSLRKKQFILLTDTQIH